MSLARKYRIVPTSSPWVSEDEGKHDIDVASESLLVFLYSEPCFLFKAHMMDFSFASKFENHSENS